MSKKIVALYQEAYELLPLQKRHGETFSDAVKRLSGNRRSILEFAGIWKEMPAEDLERIREFLEKGRQRDRERSERLFEREG